MLYSFLYKIYIRYFVIILISFEILFAGIDYLDQSSHLGDSANLQFLYVYFTALSALKITLPIALVFAIIISKIHLIRKNELVAIYSLGSTRSNVLAPFLISSILITFVYVFLQGTYFFDSYEKAQALKKDNKQQNVVNNLFFKFNNNYVFIEKLLPEAKRAINFVLFKEQDSQILQKTQAKTAEFIDNGWVLKNAQQITLQDPNNMQNSKISTKIIPSLSVLKGFKPSVMDSVSEYKENLSFTDLFYSFLLLKNQEISTQKIRGLVYSNYIVPFFAPLFTIIVFFTVPISVRFFNIALFSSAAVLITLSSWGILFGLSQLAQTASVNPEVAILLPLGVTTIFTAVLFKRHL